MTREKLVAAAVAVLCLAVGAARLGTRARVGGAREAEHREASSKTFEPDEPPVSWPMASAAEGEVRTPTVTFRLEGQTIDGDDLPIQNASVVLAGNTTQTAMTGGDGIFHFDGLFEGTYRLFAHDDNRFAGPIAVHVGAGIEPVSLRMRTASAVVIAVSDGRTRLPLAGVRLQIIDLGAVGLAAATDSAGRARLSGLPSGPHEMRLEREGYAPTIRTIVAPQPTASLQTIDVWLEAGAALSGRVVDGHGQAVPGAQVHVEGLDESARLSAKAVESTIADRQGRFVFAAIGAGSVRVLAEHKTAGSGHSEAIQLDGVSDRPGVDVRLARGELLRGRVATLAGAPVSGAIVRVATADQDLRAGRHTFSDDTGAFQLAGLAQGTLHIVAVRDGSRSPIATVNCPTADPVTLLLDTDQSIRGSVVTSLGEPVSDAQVVATPEALSDSRDSGDSTLFGVASAVTGADGRFVILGLASGTYRVRASRTSSIESPSMWLRPGIVVAAGARDARLVLDGDAIVRGRVIFKDGTSPDIFSVALTLSPPQSFGSDGGRFELHEVPAGTQALTINGPGMESKFIDGVEVRPNQTTDVGTIEVQHARSLTGRVLRANGTPVPGATVKVLPFLLAGGATTPSDDHSDGIIRCTSDPDGKFVAVGVPRIPLVAIAEHSVEGRSLPTPVPQNVEGPKVDLTVRHPGGLRGTVRRQSLPILGATVVATRPESNRARFLATTDEEGHYALESLAAGDYVVTAVIAQASARNVQSAQTVSVASDATATLDFDLPPGKVDVTVSLLARSTGRPIPNAQAYLLSGIVSARNAGQLETAIASRGTGATYMTHSIGGAPARFEGVSPASYSLCVVAVFADLTNPIAVQRVQRGAALLPAACVPLRVEDSGQLEQQSTVLL